MSKAKKNHTKYPTSISRLLGNLTNCLHQYLHALRGNNDHRRSA
jgi:hypothetical protein